MRKDDLIYYEADVFVCEFVRGDRALVHRKNHVGDMRVIVLTDFEIKMSEQDKPYWREK